MILSYRNKKTESFATGQLVQAFLGLEDQGAKRLVILNAAPRSRRGRAMLCNRLEAVRGDRAEQFYARQPAMAHLL